MKRKYKVLLKLNFLSLFFIAVSFISITLAWFAYSGFARAETSVDVKAWYIEFQKNGEAVNNDIVISIDEIFPGMEPKIETIDIKNLGDSDAAISYAINTARILEKELNISDEESGFLNDSLSHDYPFHIDVSLSKSYALKQDGSSELKVAVTWPLDSGNDDLDSNWGSKAYEFKKAEDEKHLKDDNYQPRSPVKISISLKAEQTISSDESIDLNYTLGDIILYNPTTNQKCTKVSSTCLKTNIIDIENRVGDTYVTLLPDLYKSYGLTSFTGMSSAFTELTSRWKVTSEKLTAKHLLNIISKDIESSKIKKENLSDSLIGYTSFQNRTEKIMTDVINNNGSFIFSASSFPYLTSTRCFWLEESYDETRAFTLSKLDDNTGSIKPLEKTSTCSIIPVMKIPKTNL